MIKYFRVFSTISRGITNTWVSLLVMLMISNIVNEFGCTNFNTMKKCKTNFIEKIVKLEKDRRRKGNQL
jgi:hypothetical protein